LLRFAVYLSILFLCESFNVGTTETTQTRRHFKQNYRRCVEKLMF